MSYRIYCYSSFGLAQCFANTILEAQNNTGHNAVVLAPEIAVSRWFNTGEPLTLSGLRGRPVLLHAFQMLCPGCVAHGTPQKQRAFDLFKHSDLQVIGLHTVFEHHAAMTPVSLEAFIHEYRLSFPIGVDEAAEGTPIPVTMGRYGMQARRPAS